jgi:hypothetical protein
MTARRAAWISRARSWIRDRLDGQQFEMTVVRRQPWSFVIKVRSPGKSFFFKACAEPGRHEAALLPRLAETFPDLVPAPLAVDEALAWLLLPDCGRRLKNLHKEPQRHAVWLDMLPRYAEIQRWASGRLDEWAAMGMPDRRPGRLPGALQALLADDDAICLGQPHGLSADMRRSLLAALPDLAAACRMLADGPVPASLDHGDLHNSNLLVQQGQYRLLDWGDANLAHPFCSLLVTLDALGADLKSPGARQQVAALRDAYLGAWSAFTDWKTLEKLFDAALWVGHICRALDFQHMLTLADEDFLRKFRPHIALWLRKWYANRGLFI